MRRKSRRSQIRRSTPNQAEATTHSRPSGIMRLQQLIGNQQVMRTVNYVRANDPVSSQQLPGLRGITPGKRSVLQRFGEDDQLDSRIETKSVDSVSECSVAPRKVKFEEKERTPAGSFGTTGSQVTIEYSVDESGYIKLGKLRPLYTVTIFTPYVTSDKFVEKFTPLMEKLWDEYDGDIQAFSEDSAVRNFHYYDQTLRHEMQHVGSRQLALYDALDHYKDFLDMTDGLKKGEDHFKDMTDRFWATAWDDYTEQVVTHERIHYLDALQMVREYQQRM